MWPEEQQPSQEKLCLTNTFLLLCPFLGSLAAWASFRLFIIVVFIVNVVVIDNVVVIVDVVVDYVIDIIDNVGIIGGFFCFSVSLASGPVGKC